MVCVHCNDNFLPTQRAGMKQKFCSPKCSKEWRYAQSYGVNYRRDKLSTGATGAMVELIVSVDLMKKKFEVFRALSPASSCDILAMKNGKSYPLEIRTGVYSADKKVAYFHTNIKAPYIVVYTMIDDKIHYITEPSLFQ